MVGHAHPRERNSEVVISGGASVGFAGRAIKTPTPRKLARRILEIAQQRGWTITWESGFREARSDVGRNSYTLKRGDEYRDVTVYFPIAPELYLGAM